MGFQEVQVAGMVVQLAVAVALYAWPLSRRTHFLLRVTLLAALALAGTAAALSWGFSPYPSLTDDLSFVSACISFVLLLATLTGGVLVLWEVPPLGALFCSSSGYLLQTIAAGLDRLVHVTGIVPMRLELLAAGGVPPLDVISSWTCAGLTYVLFYLLFIRKLRRDGLVAVRNPVMFFAVTVSLLVSIFFDLILKDLGSLDMPQRYNVMLTLIHLVVCSFVLVSEYEVIYSQALRESVATMERVLAEQERLYETSSQTVAAINRRVHDMRHQVFRILRDGGNEQLDREHLRQIAHEINVYDASVKTGNAALDVVLTEKGLLCDQSGVTLTCVADGRVLAFMSDADLYALFGTAVDGALAAARDARGSVGSDDADGRSVISLDVRERMGMAAISINQAFPEAAVEGPGKQAGRERLDAMTLIVDRYDGTLVPSQDADTFHLDILIPIPQVGKRSKKAECRRETAPRLQGDGL